LRDRISLQALSIVTAAWLTGFVIRPYMGVLVITGQMGALGLIAAKSKTPQGRYLGAIITLVLAWLSLAAGNQQIKEMYGEGASLRGAERKRQAFMTGVTEVRATGERSSEYPISLRATSTVGILVQLPLRIPLFLLSPIPVKWGSVPLMATYPEMLFMYWLIPRFVAGLRRVWKRNREEVLFVLCAVAPICIVFSIGTALSGEAVRYRDIFLPELLLFAGIGWAVRLQAQEGRAGGRRAVIVALRTRRRSTLSR
jgi:hypothetical protein